LNSKAFSHLYIEERAKNEPKTQALVQKFPKAQIIEISHYKNVFNAKSQDFREQKLGPKLILAKKDEAFLYPGSDFSPSFGHAHFYYNTLVLNCLYDCEYCYLQGMYSSANLVIFVNTADFFAETKRMLEEKGSLYLCISYDTDLLGLEGLLGACAEWIDFCKAHPNCVIEIRTKSANFPALSHLEPVSNVILAWTLSPEPVRLQWEAKTPSLSLRLLSVRQALDKGWKVRACLDPLLRFPEWKTTYLDFLEAVLEEVAFSEFTEVCLGTFRMNSQFLRKMRTDHPQSSILWYPFSVQAQEVRYPEEKEKEIKDYLAEEILKRDNQASILFC